MFLPQGSRVITIGDGDLSFSRALLAHVSAENLIATTYDSESVLLNKYQRNALVDLHEAGVRTEHGLDITDLNTIPEDLKGFADIVIFNHPLVPTQKSYAQYQKERNKSANLFNRALLYAFLKHSFGYLLNPNGQRLCYITTKSVKPYSHWHIETSLTGHKSNSHTRYSYLGSEPFDLSMFKNYQVRNVDRDKCVKHEASDVYVYSDNLSHKIKARLTEFKYDSPGYCPLCRKGPFANESDWELHQQTRIHKAQQAYHDDWLEHLAKSELSQ